MSMRSQELLSIVLNLYASIIWNQKVTQTPSSRDSTKKKLSSGAKKENPIDWIQTKNPGPLDHWPGSLRPNGSATGVRTAISRTYLEVTSKPPTPTTIDLDDNPTKFI
ncbi:hypothetical protein AWENTII_013015 [Aspergillus wentii]